MSVIRVGSVQPEVSESGTQEVPRMVQRYAEAARALGVNILCFPEYCLVGYELGTMAERAEPIPGPSTDYLQKVCAHTGVTIIAGTSEIANKQLYNTAVMVGPSGLLGKYRKTHLWPPEAAVFQAGTGLPVFSTPLCTIGIGICYDMEFPETARALTLKGAEILFYPSADMSPYDDKHDLYTRARAQENGVYVVNANPVGHAGGNTFFGRSQVVAPTGEVLARAGPSPALLIVDIDLSRVEEEREAMGYLSNRRPLSFYFDGND